MNRLTLLLSNTFLQALHTWLSALGDILGKCQVRHLGQVSGMRGNLVRDDAGLDIVPVGQPQVLLRRHVAQQRRACSQCAATSMACQKFKPP